MSDGEGDVGVIRAFCVPVGVLPVGPIEGLLGEITVMANAERAANIRRSAIHRSQRGGFRSGELVDSEAGPFHELRRAIEKHARDFLANLQREVVTVNPNVMIRSLWANVLREGDYHVPHTHLPLPWSGVYYVKAEHARGEGNAGCLEIYPPMGRMLHTGDSVVLGPRDGLAYMFPGALMHMVHPHAVKGHRVAVGFNIG